MDACRVDLARQGRFPRVGQGQEMSKWLTVVRAKTLV